MLSWFPLVVVVDGGSKQAVHVVVWGGTANECLRSVSKRTNKLEPNPLQLSPETLTFRTLDHRMVAARVPTGGAKGQDQRGEEEACLIMMHGATNPRGEAPHHHECGTDTGTIERGRRDKPVRVGGGGDSNECGAAHKTGARADKARMVVHKPKLLPYALRPYVPSCLPGCCIYTQTGGS